MLGSFEEFLPKYLSRFGTSKVPFTTMFVGSFFFLGWMLADDLSIPINVGCTPSLL